MHIALKDGYAQCHTKCHGDGLRRGESNPGLPRDRRGYLPLYYRGHINFLQLLYHVIIIQTNNNNDLD